MGIGHCGTVGFSWCCGSFCITDLIIGMKEGEGAILQQMIEQTKCGQGVPMQRSAGPVAMVPMTVTMMSAAAPAPARPSQPQPKGLAKPLIGSHDDY